MVQFTPMKKCCVSFLNATLMHFDAFEVIFSGVTGWYGISVMSIFEELAYWFSQWLDQFAFLYQPYVRVPHPPMLLSICCFLVIVILFWLRRNLSMILICIFLMPEEAESSFLMHINICTSSLEIYVNFISLFINQGGFFHFLKKVFLFLFPIHFIFQILNFCQCKLLKIAFFQFF